MEHQRLKERHRAEQLRDCTGVMAKLVPMVIEVMMDHSGTLWGQGTYPVVR